MLKIKHLASAELFATTKFSADSSNTTYFIGNNTTQIAGTPDVLYEDLVFCKGCDLIYTHGHFYGNQPNEEAHVSLTQEEYDALSEEEKNNGKIYLIKESAIPDLIDQLPTATTSAKGLMSAEDKTKLNSLNTLSVKLSYGTTRTDTQTKNVDYWGCGIPPAISGYTKIDRYVEILSGSDKIAAACPAYSGVRDSYVNVITKLLDDATSADFSLRVCDVYIKI